MKTLISCLCILFISCSGQTNQESTLRKNAIIGGGCDGCELMYVGMPETIQSEDTSPGWNEKGQKLIVTGTVFQLDGQTPASDVIIYYWQTDHDGYYSPRPGMAEKAQRHGHIRGWVKTGKDGKYTIRTIRPAPYPNDILPAHIHLAIKEPDLANEYYTDEINFDDDKLLIPHFKKYPQQNRGGSGIVRVLLKDSLQIAEHDIVLGLNIPDYPKKGTAKVQSGLNIGEDQPSFTPFHAFGPDKGTQTCPVCKYGRYHGIVYFVSNLPDWPAIKSWLSFLEQESEKRKQYLKVYFVYGNNRNYNKNTRQSELEKLGTELNIKNTALTFVPAFNDKATEAHLNKINPEAENTFIIYKHRSIVGKYIDLKPTTENFNKLSKTLGKTRGEYFNLPEPMHD
ncbi:dioxygenase family protein [Sediminibacterium ginsengisoli]|uniref:Protocatechuate 3,4-dioxygenase beta subunit n=1 Tax=Sediminibacterium ginsengisoli TaxID=413434 RepID=A0A1T4RXP0_9BACT|nr:intradiol ring-cleavage dioxygenase [Sediminibacterium ginsengisoli]SKA20769.1 protocatechuate 3,4-dioxygenase beta subunit [Sediminibacterium ginsengisoli]